MQVGDMVISRLDSSVECLNHFLKKKWTEINGTGEDAVLIIAERFQQAQGRQAQMAICYSGNETKKPPWEWRSWS
jgi:hypothetical protein